jgi:MGT family glycosyltransferase
MVSTGPATVSYTTKEIVGNGKLAAGWRYIGPLMDAAPLSQPAGARPFVYVALGTFFNTRAEAFRAAIDALADEPVDVLVSTGHGIVSPAQLEPLPPNVVVREFVRSREVLARASVHVTHGGCSSVHESLLAGVPMVCMPQGADQLGWSWCVEALGAGQVVEMTPAAIRAGVRRLLDDERPRRRALELGQRLGRYDGETRVAELVKRVLAGRVSRRKLSA